MGEAALALTDTAPDARAYQALRRRLAETRPPCFWPAMAPKPALSELERAGLVRIVAGIPGMCPETKMLAMIEVMRHAPAGDVVEIGAWCGRSAALFVWLARRHQVGKVLCVDPWSTEAEAALPIFQVNLAPLAQGDLNYLRARSLDAAAEYRPGLTVTTEAFGATEYVGQIALLHIDGAHSETEAANDTAAWTPHVVPGGWIVFDDYDGALGDGPAHVADAFVAANRARIAAHFSAGGALFVQLKR